MPVARIITEIFDKGLTRHIIYTGVVDKNTTIQHGPIITTDTQYDPIKELPAIEVILNDQLKEREIEAWLEDPSQAPPLIEATKDEYHTRISNREDIAVVRLTEDQALVDKIVAAKDQVKPTLLQRVVAYFKGT